MKRATSVLAGALLVVACDRPSATTTEPQSTPRFALGPDRIVGTAIGIAAVVDLSSAGVPNGRFSLNATAHANGTASGQFSYFRETVQGTVDFSGRLICLATDPVNHRAWIGAVITRNGSTNPAAKTAIHQLGKDVWFRIADYHRSDADPADRATTLGFEGSAGIITSIEYCNTAPWPADDARTFPLKRGSVSVKP
jgi:hypothetical protein